MAGYMLDELEWCGAEGSEEPNYEQCPGGAGSPVMMCFYFMAGYMLDELEWCGAEGSKEPNYEQCPGGAGSPVDFFWKEASITVRSVCMHAIPCGR